MEDVARLAGVSRSLVSLVFQDAENVSSARRAAVLKAAQSLGYRPNRLARNLARGRSMTIGVVVDDLHPFFARAVEGVERHVETCGYHALIANSARDSGRTVAALANFDDLRVDGVIAVGARGDVAELIAATPSTPLVLVASEAAATNVDSVISDESTGSALAVQHLFDQGHRRIMHVDGGLGASAAARRAGYCAAMKQLGLGVTTDVLESDFTHDAGQKAAIEIADRAERATAIFAANDLNALGLMSEFNRLDVRVPEDISIVGYDDTAVVGLGTQGLTTIHQPVFEMGTRAAELLLERMTDQRSNVTHEVLVPRLVIRSSTAALPLS